MSEFGGNPNIGGSFLARIFGKLRAFNNPNQASRGKEKAEQLKNVQDNQANIRQALVNTNPNNPINQSILTNPAISQTALNFSNAPAKEVTKQQSAQTSTNVAFQSTSDLPSYAGILNMSLKSWISEHSNKDYADLTSKEKQLLATLEGIKGFQKENYEGFDDSSDSYQGRGQKQNVRRKGFSILMQIFSFIEQSGTRDIELLSTIMNFKKLGSTFNNHEPSHEQGYIKLSPPLPNELLKLDASTAQIKYLYQLLALPVEFPECIRLFSSHKNEINDKNITSFLTQRIQLVKEQIFGSDSLLRESITKFVPLLNQNDFSIILPFVLLYYPLPLPNIKTNFNFLVEWENWQKKKKNIEAKDDSVISSCEIYYLSKKKGRFLIKLELNKSNELSFDIVTNEGNEDVVEDLKIAVSEIMFLLSNPPLLSDLNVLLTREIYNATDIDEELSLVSNGPIKIEIVLAVYASLIILNKYNSDISPSGGM